MLPRRIVLDESDDVDLDNCENGFQYDVSVATSAKDGTPAVLYAGTTQVGTAEVRNALIVFEGVQLTARGTSALSVQVGAEKNCTASRTVEVACSVPSCAITKPAVSAAHPALNGVPAGQGGDRASAEGTPYQVFVEVETSIDPGQPVELLVNGSSVPGLAALADNGKAVFPGVTLTPDGNYELEAVCRGKSGFAGRSAKATYVVDTASPELTVTEPAANAYFEEAPTFRVCGTTTSEDAINLPGALGESAQNNFCASVGTATPVCRAVTGAAGSACVDLDCPGGPAFDVRVSLRDAAGNTQRTVVPSISCRTDRLGAEIVSPVASVAGNIATNLLSATSGQAFRDLDATKIGAQTDVRACTDAPNATMTLKAGLVGGALASVSDAVQVQLASLDDGCPAGKAYVARFVGVTLPESAEGEQPSEPIKTRLQVEVVDESGIVGESSPVDVWVDSINPTLAVRAPALCGLKRQSTGTWTTNVSFFSSVWPLRVTFTGPDGIGMLREAEEPTGSGFAEFAGVEFALGHTSVAAEVVEASGNRASLPSPCEVSVGNPPVVTWLSPAPGSSLNATNDADINEPGWQGDLRVRVDVADSVTPRPTVQFFNNGTPMDDPVELGAGGIAVLPGVTLDEGASVRLLAETDDVPGRGVGSALYVASVDVDAPDAVADLVATVPEHLRRQTTFRLRWTAPDDGGKPVHSYQIRVSEQPITNDAEFNAATVAFYVGSPAQPGEPDTADVNDLLIERTYYFAIVAVDAAGNRSPIATADPAAARFRTTTLRGTVGTTEAFGFQLDGSSDLNNDGFADILVGANNGSRVYAFFGAEDGFPSTASVVFQGPSGVQFGAAVEVIGDIDGDGRPEIAIGAPQDAPGKVYIFRGRAAWPATLSFALADYVIGVDAALDPGFSGGLFGGSLAKVGDFDGDGAQDFVIGASRYRNNLGYVALIRGVRAGEQFPSYLSLTTPSDRFMATPGRIEGTVTNPRLGWAVTGLGRFYPGNGTAFVGSAYIDARLVAFAGSVDVNAAADYTAFSARNSGGGFSIAAIGQLASPMAVAIGGPAHGTNTGSVQIHRGTIQTGPFVDNPVVLTNAKGGTLGNGFGSCVMGSVISGVDASYSDHRASFIGNAGPDVAIGGLGEGTGAASLYIIDGQKVPTLVSGDIAAVADVIVPLPAEWLQAVGSNTGCGPYSRAIRDLNNDGYADLAVVQWRSLSTYAGEVLVLW